MIDAAELSPRRVPATLALVFGLIAAHMLLGSVEQPRADLPATLGYAFRHVDLGHLLLNVAVLGVAGVIAERALGSLRYVALLFAAWLLATAAEFALAGPGAVGASGIALAAAGYAVLAPAGGRERLLTLGLAAAALWADATFNPAPIASVAHAAGFAVGAATAFLFPPRARPA